MAVSKFRQDSFPGGVWPTMITPFTAENKIDYAALQQMINWYIEHQVNGLFAVCQSSEMFALSLQERVDLTRAVVEFTDGRVPIVASGHISDHLDDQIQEITAISKTGIQAFILVSNRLATPDQGDDVWENNLLKVLDRIPEIPLGIYECPTPYKRLMSPDLLGRIVELERKPCSKLWSWALSAIAV